MMAERTAGERRSSSGSRVRYEEQSRCASPDPYLAGPGKSTSTKRRGGGDDDDDGDSAGHVQV